MVLWCCKVYEAAYCTLEYRIAGNFRERKLFANWWKIGFLWRKLLRIARFCFAKRCHAPNSAEKTFAKLWNLWKFSPLKVFIRYLDVCGSYVPSTFFPLTACPHTIINPFFLSDITHKRKYTRKKKAGTYRSSVWACSAYVTLLGIVQSTKLWI